MVGDSVIKAENKEGPESEFDINKWEQLAPETCMAPKASYESSNN